jgi:glycosyltransferase involved in cell wall biosynthesis
MNGTNLKIKDFIKKTKIKKMKLSIVTPTYYRSDGSTLSHLKKALDSLFNQTHQDFKI